MPLQSSVLLLVLLACTRPVVVLLSDGEGQDVDELGKRHIQQLFTAQRVTELMAQRRGFKCPSMILFHSGEETKADEDANLALNHVVSEVGDLVKFGIVNCKDLSRSCANHNVRKPPSIILYPTDALPRWHQGSFDKDQLLTDVMKSFEYHDRTMSLTSQNMNNFMYGSFRPFVALIFGGTIPAFFRALSTDEELWPMIQFGHVDKDERAIWQQYGVLEAPTVVFQVGTNSETTVQYTRQSSSNNFHFAGVKEWLLARIELVPASSLKEFEQAPEEEAQTNGPKYQMLPLGTAACPNGLEITSLAECVKALEALGMDTEPRWVSNYPGLPSGCSIREEATSENKERLHFNGAKSGAARDDLRPVCLEQPQVKKSAAPKNTATKGTAASTTSSATPSTTPAAKAQYDRLPHGANGCPEGLEITSVDECQKAIESLGMQSAPRWVSNYDGLPRHCSVRASANKENKERMHFNTASSGLGRSDLQPICKRGAAQSTPKAQTQAKDFSKGSIAIPELSRVTYERHFDDGFLMIYLVEGIISPQERTMLTRLWKEYEQVLQQQGTKLKLAWMNVYVEQEFLALFGPQVLPSAAIVSPKKRPRLSLMTHHKAEDDNAEEKLLPADEASLANFFSALLDGNLKFQQVSVEQLRSFVVRNEETKLTPQTQTQSAGTSKKTVKTSKKTSEKVAAAKQKFQTTGLDYQKLPYGTEGCPTGFEISSVEECAHAIGALGISWEPAWISNYDGLPRYCSIRETTDKQSTERMHYNSAASGAARKDLAPVCKRDEKAQVSVEADSQNAAEELPRDLVPELSGSTRTELLGIDGYSFIYISGGSITAEEQTLLISLKNEMLPQAATQEIQMNFMWMNLFVERKFRDIFDPPALPSAVILDQREEPRFALAPHLEKDGDPMPVDAAVLRLFVSQLIAGELAFRNLKAKSLAYWAARRRP